MTIRFLAAVLVAAAAALTAPSGAGAVSAGASGWQWGNPTPTGALLIDVGFSGTTGYAVGQLGTMLKSTDGGRTWTGLRTGVSGPLSAVQTLSPEIVAVGGGCSALLSTTGGASFSRLYFTATSCRSEFAGVAFVSATSGYLALRNGTFLHTTDGGATWTPKTSIPGASSGIFTGFAGGIWAATPTSVLALQSGTGGSKIYRSTDSGGSWTEVFRSGEVIEDITMVDADTGFAVGRGGVLATTDGGATWALRNPNGQARSVAAFSPTQAVFVAAAPTGTTVLTTADGGTTLSSGVSTGVQVQASAYTSATGVVAVGAGSGGVTVSRDGGATFPAGAGGDTVKARLGRLRFAPGGAVATGDGGALARTSDGGKTWARAGVPTSEVVTDVNFPSGQIGYAIDATGRLFKTMNNGRSWASLDTGTTARPTAIAAAGASTVMLIGPTGVRRSKDGAESFSTVTGPVARRKLTDYDMGAGAFFTWDSRALLRSTNRGASWSRLALPSPKTKISQVDFATSSTGYLRDTRGRVYRTSNAGSSWSPLTSVGTSRLSGMAFSSSSTGFLVTSWFGVTPGTPSPLPTPEMAFVLRTTDGGTTWAPQLVFDKPVNPNGILAGATSYLLADNGLLLSSTTGGVSGAPSAVSVKPSSTKLSKPTGIRVTITVRGATQGDIGVVAARAAGGRWDQQRVVLDSTGKATTSWRVAKATTFVGQWAGNEDAASAGSRGVKVTVG